MKNKKISIIITAWKEPETVHQLVLDLESQIRSRKEQFEILLLCPDEQTANSGIEADSLDILRWVRDERKGKPAALNQAFLEAQGNVLILTDGDISVTRDAVGKLLGGFTSSQIGAVTGRPIPSNSRKTMFGYWAHLLTEAGAHYKRLRQQQVMGFIICSGYLMAIRSSVVDKIPENSLVDDAVISHKIWNAGFGITYVPGALVYVKFPTNFKDWLKQKKRSAGGYVQLPKLVTVGKDSMRSFPEEVWGIWDALSYPRDLKEFWWTFLLVLARLYLWLIIFWDHRIIKKSFNEPWARVESTK